MNAAQDMPHVLVVEDNPDAAEILGMLIECEGFTTATAHSLAEARQHLADQPPRMVFLDLSLPDGSGMDLLAEIKSDQTQAHIEVVLLTGSQDLREMEQAHLLGAAGFLVKPLGHAELTAVLQRAR